MENIEEVLRSTRTAALNGAALHYLFKASERAVKDKIVVLSPGGFSGNSKYIYSYLHRLMGQHGLGDKLFWLSHNRAEAEALKGAGINAHWSQQDGASMRLLIETKVAFLSTHHFPRADYCVMQAALSAATKVQMWHGVPAKHIAYELAGRRGNAVDFAYYAYDCLSADYVVTESDYVTPRYQPGFPNAKPIVAGSARTDILLADLQDFPFWHLGTNAKVIERMRDWRQSGRKVVIYAPTYREASQDRTGFLAEVKAFIEAVARDENILLIFKNHSSSRDQDAIVEIIGATQSERILVAPSKDDSYPYMREADVLITDYSSIYYDFLLTKRQVMFFQPDYEAYTATRQIYDEQQILGRPLGFSARDGLTAAENLQKIEPPDYAVNRSTVRDKLFASQNGQSSARLLSALEREIDPQIFGAKAVKAKALSPGQLLARVKARFGF